MREKCALDGCIKTFQNVWLTRLHRRKAQMQTHPVLTFFMHSIFFPFLLLIVCTEIKLKHNFTAVSAMLEGTSVVIGTGRQLFF